MSKKILLIAPLFFGYHKLIAEQLERKGFEVVFMPDVPFKSVLLKLIQRVFPSLVNATSHQRFVTEVEKHEGSFDKVLVVKGEGLSEKILEYLKKSSGCSELTLYLWDSLANTPNLRKLVPFYSKVFSFDPEDCAQYGFSFRPLFYCDGFTNETDSEMRYDLSFVGTVHSDRLEIIGNVMRSVPEHYSTFIYPFARKRFFAYLMALIGKYSWENLPFLRYETLSIEETEAIFQESKIILDIQHPGQTGLTMRVFETIGAGKKLITTNAAVKNYDFYDSKRVLVIERPFNRLDIPDYFMSELDQELDSKVLDHYTLSRWVDDIVS